jgi:hypothetical protein
MRPMTTEEPDALNLDDVRRLKQDLANGISGLIEIFEERTGLPVVGVEVQRVPCGTMAEPDASLLNGVEVQVRL